MMYSLLWVSFVCFIFSPISTSSEWELNFHNKKCNDSRTVYWITVNNESTVVHFLFAADKHVRPPAIIVLLSNYPSSTVDVNCTLYENNATFRNSIKVDAVSSSYGILLYELCDYIDLNDHAELPPNVDCHRYFGSNLDWEVQGIDFEVEGMASVTFRGTQYNDSHDIFLPGGAAVFQVFVYARTTTPLDAYYYRVPGGLSMEVRITVDRLKVLYPQTRVAPVLFVFSNQSVEDTDDFVDTSGYAVGAFDGPLGKLQSQYVLLDKRKSGQSPPHDSSPAFVQIVPVCVTNPDPTAASHSLRSAKLAYRSVVKHKGTARKYAHSIPYAYYGRRFDQIHQGPKDGHVGVREQFINLGSPKDGFYIATNYTSWTLLLTLGTPDVYSEQSNGSKVTVGLVCTLVIAIACGTGFGYVYRRRQMARQLIHRIVPSGSDEHTGTLPIRERMDPVEPFQRRKLFPFGRSRQGDGGSTHPLLPNDPPPSYDSVSVSEI